MALEFGLQPYQDCKVSCIACLELDLPEPERDMVVSDLEMVEIGEDKVLVKDDIVVEDEDNADSIEVAHAAAHLEGHWVAASVDMAFDVP